MNVGWTWAVALATIGVMAIGLYLWWRMCNDRREAADLASNAALQAVAHAAAEAAARERFGTIAREVLSGFPDTIGTIMAAPRDHLAVGVIAANQITAAYIPNTAIGHGSVPARSNPAFQIFGSGRAAITPSEQPHEERPEPSGRRFDLDQ